MAEISPAGFTKNTLIIIGVLILFSAAAIPVIPRLIAPQGGMVNALIEESRNIPQPSGTIHFDVAYGNRAVQRLDIYEPLTENTGENAPLVVFFHGGSWIQGDKVTIRIIHRFLERMRLAGYAVAAVNYSEGIRGMIHRPVANSALAVQWLIDNGGEYGIDTGRIGLYGVSAGGNIALLMEDAFRDSGRISFVLSECAPVDLPAMAAGEAFDSSRYLDLLPEKYLKRYSPLMDISAETAPVLIYHGDADDVVDVHQAYRLNDALIEAGAHSELEIYVGGTHAFLGMSDELWYRQETRALEFMNTYFTKQGDSL